ncbi:MAG: hypothetical protein JO223_21515 [Hyphomicrobiales bacterium]|nr:hypothetical protein [Hyphomicrobiales bacterium]MBV8441020.1 hypothetical protein [Hyphomicrobiales bacterium]
MAANAGIQGPSVPPKAAAVISPPEPTRRATTRAAAVETKAKRATIEE